MWITLTLVAPLPLLILLDRLTGIHWLLHLLIFEFVAFAIGKLYFGAWVSTGGWLTELARAQLRYSLHPAQGIDKERNYIFACHPHHVMSFSMILSFIRPGASEKFIHSLKKRPVPLVSDSIFLVTLIGLYLKLAGARPASRRVVEALLAEGESIALNPGGTREMAVNRTAGQRRLTLIRRTSFLFYALKHRVPVVPLLSLGEENAYTHWHFLDWFHRVSKHRLDYPGPLLSTGLLGSFFPKPCTVSVVMGEPVAPEADDDLASFSERYYTRVKELAASNNYTLDLVESSKALYS
jgi:1-acyl-sn-glycerol-3-phosphate acyltransferase